MGPKVITSTMVRHRAGTPNIDRLSFCMVRAATRGTVLVMRRLTEEERAANKAESFRRNNAKSHSACPHLVRATAPDDTTTSEIQPYQLRTPSYLGPGCRWVRGARWGDDWRERS